MAIKLTIPMGPVRHAAKLAVEDMVSAARSKHITVTAGQSEIYNKKLEEATLLKEGTVAPTPFLTYEAELKGVSKEDLALTVLERKEQTDKALVVVETFRTYYKLQIEQAATAKEIDNLMAEAAIVATSL